MAVDVSIISASVTSIGNLPPPWEFSFTTGYGAWALSWAHGSQCPVVPWEVVLEVQYNSGNSFFQHKQIGDRHHLCTDISDAPFEHECDLRLFVWTKTQSLYITDPSGLEVLLKFPWEKPYTHLCGCFALIESGYYDEGQLDLLCTPFDPPEWAGKGAIVDDQTFFDAWVSSSKMLVYNGYWKYFMNRFCNFMKQRDLLSICHPRITGQTRFSIEGQISSRDRSQLEERMPLFFSSELEVGIYSRIPRAAVEEFHKNLPHRIREWIERRSV